MDNIFIARQPIYTRKMDVLGYELLYRNNNNDNYADFEDGNLASSQVIVNAFMNVGVDSMVGSTMAFVNLTDLFFTNDSLIPMHENQVVLEVLEHVMPSHETMEGIERLKNKGYKIALDDFDFEEKRLSLLDVADYVKIDVLHRDMQELKDCLDKLAPYNVISIAERVESHEMFTQCEELGFDAFQGYFFCKPKIVNDRTLTSNQAVIFALINELQDPAKTITEIAGMLAHDVALSYKILRYINSASFTLRKEVESIDEALMLIGVNTIKNWAYMIMMSRMLGDKPQELIVVALVRAKMCELVGGGKQGIDAPKLFVMGLFSTLDALLDRPMADLLDELSLPGEIKLAILEHEGVYGQILEDVILYEQGRWIELIKKGIDVQPYINAYLDAIEWADTSKQVLSDNLENHL